MYVSKRVKLEIVKSEVYIKGSVKSYIWTSHIGFCSEHLEGICM